MKTLRTPKVPKYLRGSYQRPEGESLVDRAASKSKRTPKPPQSAAKARKSGRRHPSDPDGWDYDRSATGKPKNVVSDGAHEGYQPTGRHRHPRVAGRHRTPYEGTHRKR